MIDIKQTELKIKNHLFNVFGVDFEITITQKSTNLIIQYCFECNYKDFNSKSYLTVDFSVPNTNYENYVLDSYFDTITVKFESEFNDYIYTKQSQSDYKHLKL